MVVMDLTFIGISLSIAGAMFTSSGLCLQKIFHKNISSSPHFSAPSRHRYYYVFGIAYVVIGQILKMINDGILPQSAVAPLSAQTVIYTTILETVYLDEKPTKMLLLCLLVTLMGMAISISASNLVDPTYSLMHILKLFVRYDEILFTSFLLAIIISARFMVPIAPKPFSLDFIYRVVAAGILTGWTGTIGKSVIKIISYTMLYDSNELLKIGVWVIILIIPLLSIPKINMINNALESYHYYLFLPFYQAAAIICNGLFGIIYYKDFSYSRIHDTTANLHLYLLGLLITCIGIILLAHKYDPSIHKTTGMELTGITTVIGEDSEISSLLPKSTNSNNNASNSNANRHAVSYQEMGDQSFSHNSSSKADRSAVNPYLPESSLVALTDDDPDGYMQINNNKSNSNSKSNSDSTNSRGVQLGTHSASQKSYNSNASTTSTTSNKNANKNPNSNTNSSNSMKYSSSPMYSKKLIGNWQSTGNPFDNISDIDDRPEESMYNMTPERVPSLQKTPPLFSGKLFGLDVDSKEDAIPNRAYSNNYEPV